MAEDYKVADMSLAEWGRKEIAIAETVSFVMPVELGKDKQDVSWTLVCNRRFNARIRFTGPPFVKL